MSTADLLLAFEADDADALLTALRTSTAEERSSAWDEASDAFRPRRWHAEFAALDPESAKRRARTQALFCLAAGPPDVVKRVGSFVVSVPSEDEFTEMLSLRTQTWKVEFAAASLRTWAGEKEVGLFGPWWWENWLRVRHYERTGVVPFDSGSVDYLVVFVRGLTFSDSIDEALVADSGLLEHVWDLFQPNEGVQRALMGGDRYWDPANTWRAALVRLVLGGHLDPSRLRVEAERAAADERLRRNQQAWYRGIIRMLDDPAVLPSRASTGPPPPGNRLQR